MAENNTNEQNSKKQSDKVLSKSLEENIKLFQEVFSNDQTLKVRRFQNKHFSPAKCCVIYFDYMVNTKTLNESIIEPILRNNLSEGIDANNLLVELQYKVIAADEVEVISDVTSLIGKVIYGDTIFLLEGYEKALVINSKGWQTRAISEPESEKVVRGPREGFTESIMLNISLLRRRIKTPDLKLKFREIGSRTHTTTCVCYIESLADTKILEELEKRLDEINIDAVLDSGYIQELIRDAPFSPFQTVGNSEKPDSVAGKLLEGRVALIVDGSPSVLTVPFVLAEASQSCEDYYNNYIFASFNRLLRSTANIWCVSIPALYLAVVTFHQEMLPTPLLLSISAGREGVPFPTVLSLIIMMIIFDILREAGTRMPAPIGQAINIVGTLVLGEAAVQAKLVSAHVVIVTALTGILTLMNISLLGAIILIRFYLLITTAIMGVYGYLFGMLTIVIHLMSIRSFGVPYMLSLTRVKDRNYQDAWVRAPWWSMTLRPKIIGAKNLVRKLKKEKEK